MPMDTLRLAFDLKSARYFDADGRLHVTSSHISKATVNPYYGYEIPGWEDLGLEKDKVYRLLRDPVELERGAPTFARLNILSGHDPITVETLANNPDQRKLIVGNIGSDIQFKDPYLDADLCIFDAAAIAGIETNQIRELSCSYRYVPVMEQGEYKGESYDGRMTDIRGNHLALVSAGRAGPDILVADSAEYKTPKDAMIALGVDEQLINEVVIARPMAIDKNPFNFKETTMKMTKLGKAMFATLAAVSPVLAADSALAALVGNANRKTFNKSSMRDKLIAMDATLSPEQLDNVIDALLDVEQDPEPVEPPVAGAGDESPAEKVRTMLAGKVDEDTINAICALIDTPAQDEEQDDDKVDKKDMEAAMDSLRGRLRDANKASLEVRPTVGDVAMDSAAEIYAFALDHLKVDHKDVAGAPALRALYRLAVSAPKVTQAPSMAADSAGMSEQFPQASRFGRG